MIVKLSNIIDHEQFMWSRSHGEVKDNFVEIISDLTGFKNLQQFLEVNTEN